MKRLILRNNECYEVDEDCMRKKENKAKNESLYQRGRNGKNKIQKQNKKRGQKEAPYKRKPPFCLPRRMILEETTTSATIITAAEK